MKRTTSVPAMIISLALSTIITSAILSPIEACARASARTGANPVANSQSGCPYVFPAGPVAVSPNQPGVPDQSPVGVINGLLAATLHFIGCAFLLTMVMLRWVSNGDGMSEHWNPV